HRTITFKTIDGTKLEAWLWEADGPAPVIIMSTGLNCVKEMSLEETGDNFQHAGYNVLLYDARSIGGSGGLPRNQPDPWKYVEDLSDVVTFAMTLPTVDPLKILLWGISLGASISGCTAAIDRRVAGVIMVAPIFKFIRPDKRRSVFNDVSKDRQSQLRGNPPFTLQPFDVNGENPAGYAGSGGPGGLEAKALMEMASERGHPSFRDKITMQTFLKLALFRPQDLMEELLDETPVMMVTPELDNMSLPEHQKAAFDSLQCRKKLYMVEGKGHLGVLAGAGYEETIAEMLGFYGSVIKGT
ncbi:DltD domain-containing protein, partial [Stipitochalara longipes BDJ]